MLRSIFFGNGLCLAVVLVSVTTSFTQAADWPRFRGPNGSAVSEAQNLPTKWDDKTNLLWKTPLPGPGSSSPIVVGERIYLTCYTGYGADRSSPGDIQKLERHLICASLTDGKIVWDKAVAAAQPEDPFQGYIRDHGYATSTPASDGERIYVFYGKSGVLAFDLDGNELWRAPVGTGSAKNRWGTGSSPIIYKNLVIVNAAAESRAMVGLDKLTGKEVWKSDADNLYSSWSTPVMVDAPEGKQELVVSAPYELWGFDPETGKFLWYAEAVADETICGSVVTRGNVVYAVGGRGGSAVAITSGGRGDVSKTHTLWTKSLSSYVPSPVLAGDRIFCVNERGILGCLNAKDGQQEFQARLSNAGSIYASPVAADGKVFLVTRQNGTFVIAADGDGKSLALNKFDDDSDFNASPAVANGKLLLRSNRALYCVGNKP